MAVWRLHGDGREIGPGQVVAPDERLTWGRTVGIGAQHVVAMFGATFVFPLVMGLNWAAAHVVTPPSLAVPTP